MLGNRIAVVTGATRGIGKAIATALLERGDKVIATGTSKDGVVPEGCEYYSVDFLDTEATNEFASQLKVIKPNVLFNNAGINKISPFKEIEVEDFERIQKVNVYAPFKLCKAVIPGMLEQNWGRIVNVSSIWGKISKEYRASYGTSKFAIDGMTAALSAEVAQHNVLVNCVAPGFIDTELTREVLGEEGIAKLVEQVPARRLGTTQEIAKFAIWLAGPENTYITGQNIAIDGGFTRV